MKTSRSNSKPNKTSLPNTFCATGSDKDNSGMVIVPEEEEEEEWQNSIYQHHPLSSSTFFSKTRNIADFLMSRQELTGLTLATRRQGHSNYPIQPQQLASSVAWNAQRMQNMILAVGPGTPATLCWPVGESDDDEDHDEDDDEDDDDDSPSVEEDEDEAELDAVMMQEEEQDEEENMNVTQLEEEEPDDEAEQTSPPPSVAVAAAAAAAASAPSSQDGGGGGRRTRWQSTGQEDDDDDDDKSKNDSNQEEKEQQAEAEPVDASILRHAAFRGILRRTSTAASASSAAATPTSRNTRRRRGSKDDHEGDKKDKDESSDEMEDDEDDDDDEDQAQAAANRQQESLRALARRLVLSHQRRTAHQHNIVRPSTHRRHLGHGGGGRGRAHSPPSRQHRPLASSAWTPSLRHNGCINTACWLDCNWRISLAANGCNSMNSGSSVSVPSTECPTQLATSGDDRVVKIWDLSMAMGMGNVQPGGWDTFAPFASSQQKRKSKDCLDDSRDDGEHKWKDHSHHHEQHGNSFTRNRTRAWRNYYYNHQGNADDRDNEGNDACYIPPPPGSVLPLATIPTGHGGNVFYVTPVPSSPGRILTCAADGYLRLSHVDRSTSTVVVHPMESGGRGGGGGDGNMSDNSDSSDNLSFLFHSSMAYSHHMLNENTGLLCSDRGLHRFDIRLPPRQQQRKSLLSSETLSGSCKACAVWNPNQQQRQRQRNGNLNVEDSTGPSSYSTDPNYVFAGGSSEYVGLYDLRMTPSGTGTGNGISRGGGDGGRIVERYKPRDLQKSGRVSVSGLDVTKDGRELLVSYESDQIYAFPICHEARSAAGPTLSEMEKWSTRFSNPRGTLNDDEEGHDDDDSDDPDKPDSSSKIRYQSDIMAYGGHLNRFTFLKNAKYAGPNDDYICTGSDGGHAWIYERSTGAVVSLLSADTSTCNGVVPHPSLPFFVTYGIDSTAKLWRATLPVDINADDSPRGRARSALDAPYEMSPVTRSYNGVQLLCRHFKEEPAIFPDYIASGDEIAASGRFSSPRRRGMLDYNYDNSDNAHSNNRGIINRSYYDNQALPPPPRIGNAIRTLPMMLRQNRYECYRAMHEDDGGAAGVPIDSSLYALSHRICIMRLRHQADRLGLEFDLARPWTLELPPSARQDPDEDDDDGDGDGGRGDNAIAAHRMCNHPADLVPDYPSDWINLDRRMRTEPLTADITYNLLDYESIFLERDSQLWSRVKVMSRSVWSRNAKGNISGNMNQENEKEEDTSVPWLMEAQRRRQQDAHKEQVKSKDDDNFWPTTSAVQDATMTPTSEAMTKGGLGTDGAEDEEEGETELTEEQRRKSRELLYETALLLKEGGNVAMKQGQYHAAARRYDKAIQYCAVAFMSYVEGKIHLPHLTQCLGEDVIESNPNSGSRSSKKKTRRHIIVVWSPLLRVLITAHLNLALLLLKKPVFCQANRAADQAKAALRLLGPFAVVQGKVVFVNTKGGVASDKVLRENESPQTYYDAKALQAKAFFRLGSAEMEMGNYAEAVESLELSIDASSCSSVATGTLKKPDALVARRLQEAKSKLKSKKKRDRRKFEFAISDMPDVSNKGASA